MNGELVPLDAWALAFIGLYLSSLVVIGWFGYRARREHSMRDFYLAGPGIGFVVLLLTLYATQYSGNTLFGFTGKTYRIGYAWVMSLHFMTAIVVFYLLLAPKLHALAKRNRYITPTDFLNDRFGSAWINLIASVVMVVAISNYLLAQIMAMGRALEGLTTLDPEKAYFYGVILLALIIVLYETLGGFRAVVWTDVIQGTVLMIGFAALMVLVFRKFGALENATKMLLASSPENRLKVMPPDAARCREWASYILAVGIGGALYPQAIQRLYAARSATTLRRSLAVMAFLPLTTTLIALLVGVMGAAYVPGLITHGAGGTIDNADKLLTVICRQIQQESLLGYWLVVVLFAAILAAIMSTADSVLLTISSMLTKDIYARFVRPRASERELAWLGKITSWALIVVAAFLAITLKNKATLVQLLDRKFDLLLQMSPAFFIGIHWSRLRAGPTLAGMIVGVAVAAGLAACGLGKLAGIHAGIYGLAANATIAVAGSWMMRNRGPLFSRMP